MFFRTDIFEQLLCCRRKVFVEDEEKGVPAGLHEEILLQHTNNNKTEYITSSQLLEHLKGGTTAVVALIKEKRLVVAWLGDSQALLVRKRIPVQIVEPHKPDMPSERHRIEKSGGCVVNIQGTWRVLGQLAVSRAIGDVNYKPFVSSECDIKSLEIVGDEDFLILACDGLWDSLSHQDAVNIVYSYLTKNDGDTDGVGRCLVEASRQAGSQDNITAVVVFLRPVSVLMEEESARLSHGQVREMDSFVITQKDALPPSINAIFSPPPNFMAPGDQPPNISIPDFNEGEFICLQDINEISPGGSVPGEVVIHDSSDSDEGVGLEKEELPRQKGTVALPTEEEVDAALAELDSLHDGEAADADDGEDEDEGWAYYKMEPQKQDQKEDVIVTTSSETRLESQPINVMATKMSPNGSPRSSGSSPKAVEGFVTSVELNTPEESFNTNLAINQSVDLFAGSQVEQNSGPFSVYVSSTPEPLAVDSPMLSNEDELSGLPSVEVVHAQSTIEVMDVSETNGMKEQIGGDVAGPYFALHGDASQEPGNLVDDFEETTRNFEELLSEAKQYENYFEHMEGNELENLPTPLIGEPSFLVRELPQHRISEESSNLIVELETSVKGVSDVVNDIKSEDILLDFSCEKGKFASELTKAFQAPLDEVLLVSNQDDQMETVRHPLDSDNLEGDKTPPPVTEMVDVVAEPPAVAEEDKAEAGQLDLEPPVKTDTKGKPNLKATPKSGSKTGLVKSQVKAAAPKRAVPPSKALPQTKKPATQKRVTNNVAAKSRLTTTTPRTTASTAVSRTTTSTAVSRATTAAKASTTTTNAAAAVPRTTNTAAAVPRTKSAMATAVKSTVSSVSTKPKSTVTTTKTTAETTTTHPKTMRPNSTLTSKKPVSKSITTTKESGSKTVNGVQSSAAAIVKKPGTPATAATGRKPVASRTSTTTTAMKPRTAPVTTAAKETRNSNRLPSDKPSSVAAARASGVRPAASTTKPNAPPSKTAGPSKVTRPSAGPKTRGPTKAPDKKLETAVSITNGESKIGEKEAADKQGESEVILNETHVAPVDTQPQEVLVNGDH